MKILVTGGAGFIGSNFVRIYLEKHPEDHVNNLDSLTYAGNIKNLDPVIDNRSHTFMKGDIRDVSQVQAAMEGVDAVVHFAAESHVDRSIDNASLFLETNVIGTGVLLEAAWRKKIKKFLHVSTDEVYGSIEKGLFTEESPVKPNSPYSASKASSDLLALSYFSTYGFPVVVTRCSNNFGPYQFPEKLIPLFITNAMADQPLPIYGDGMNVRDWIHVEDHCEALDAVLQKGRAGEVYNIGGGNERNNLEITDLILEKLKKPQSLKKFIEDRPGHDRRYAIDSSKMQNELGWNPRRDFDEAIDETIKWYIDNEEWWGDVKTGKYMEFYEKLYAKRLAKALLDKG
ncbi:MAG: dTDP-glucose 4,6-dehydratase [Nitrospinota bacterium]